MGNYAGPLVEYLNQKRFRYWRYVISQNQVIDKKNY